MAKPVILGVLASGRGSNLQSILDAINSGEISAQVGVVISDKPEANALKRAADLNIAAVCVDRKQYKSQQDFEQALINQLELYKVDLVILAGFMRILSSCFVNAYPNKIMNIHPSLLPAFPGKNAQQQALLYGAKVSGCTVHFVDEGMDTGPIILQQSVPVLENDTPESLAERILQQEHMIYPQAIKFFVEGRLQLEGRLVKLISK